jgi:hypothetical protein
MPSHMEDGGTLKVNLWRHTLLFHFVKMCQKEQDSSPGFELHFLYTCPVIISIFFIAQDV